MKQENLTPVWVTTPRSEILRARTETAYARLRRVAINLQMDHSELDIQTYGKTVSELIKLRSDTPPDISKGDRLYLSEPPVRRRVELAGEAVDDYGPGEYRVEAVRPAHMTGKHVKKPTLSEAVRTGI